MRTITPGTIPTKDLHQFILGCVAPRPIAWVSTMDEEGRPNLAPYSFFNAFSSNPPIVVFSSNRKVSDNTTKDTLYNIKATGEAVINMVNYDLVRKMALTSVEFPQGISEFGKAGLTAIASEEVKPFRVLESPAHLEVRVKDIITLGDQGGAGHLVICDVVKLHIDEAVLDGDRIDPHKIDLMGRMGRAFYTRASGDAIQTIYQPVVTEVIGYEALPLQVKQSSILSANNIGALSAMKSWPKRVEDLSEELRNVWESLELGKSGSNHSQAKKLLDESEGNAPLAALLLNTEGVDLNNLDFSI